MFSKKTYPEFELLNEYLDFLRDYQCLSEATIVIRRNFVAPFLMEFDIERPQQMLSLSAKNIHDYIIENSPPLHRASRKHLTSSIRSFLRFSFIKSYIKSNLSDAVPVITTRKLEQLPESISWNDVEKLLAMPNVKTPRGRRDLAVMMLCIYYGVRIGQVTALKLSDIHWTEGSICFAGCKWSNPVRLPLLEGVAEALLFYIRMDRKNPNFEEVFLTIKGNQRPLSKHNHYSSNLKK